MKNKLLFLFGLLLILTAPGCRKELDNMSFEQLKFYESDILGVVVDEEGNAISDATVSFDGQIKKTDKNGVYIFKDVEVNSRHSVIHVIKEGYFEGIRVFSTAAEAKIQLRTVLLEKRFEARFDGSTGGSVSSGNVTLEFPAQAVMVESSKALYTGEVSVAIKYLDPEDENISAKMPGNLSGINADNRLSVLTTYGMVAVELRGSGGQKLNIATGSKVKMSADIPASLRSKAPSSIPLWYFDEESGYWKEEGRATISGDKYIGEVSHFSYWNYDAQHPPIILSGRIVDQNGNPVSGLDVRVYATNEPSGGHGYTNPDGTFSGPVAKDLPLTIQIMSIAQGGCFSQVLYTGNIGPFANDATLPDIAVNIVQSNSNHVHGNVIDCAGNPVQNGYVEINLGPYSRQFLLIENGTISGIVINCQNNPVFTYFAVDQDALVESQEFSSALSLDTDLGTISACGIVADHLILNIPDLGHSQTIAGSAVSMFSDTYGYLYATDSLNTKLQFTWNDADVGNFNTGTYNINYGNMNISQGQNPNQNEYTATSGTVTITSGGGWGSTIEGSYSIDMKEQSSGIIRPINGSFKKKFH